MRKTPAGVKHPMEAALTKHAMQPASQHPTHPNKAIESLASAKKPGAQKSTTVKRAINP